MTIIFCFIAVICFFGKETNAQGYTETKHDALLTAKSAGSDGSSGPGSDTISTNKLEDKHPKWLLNYPKTFHGMNSLGDKLVDVRGDEGNMTFYKNFIHYFLERVDGFTDGKM